MLIDNLKKLENLKSNKIRCLVLSIIFLFIYFITTTFVDSHLYSYTFSYALRLSLWFGLAIVIHIFPAIREHGKIKLKPLLNLWTFNFAAIYVAVLFLFGLIYGFGKSPYSHSLKGMFINILMLGMVLVAKERFRSYLVNSLAKTEYSAVFILVSFFMAFTDTALYRYLNFSGYKDTIQFFAQFFLPNFTLNLMAAFLVYWGGSASSIIYMGVIQGVQWFSPILPNLNWIISALIGALCPVFSLMSLQNIYLNEAKIIKNRERKRESLLGWASASVCSIIIVWFAVGVFPIYPAAVATGSMRPIINPGDITLNKRVKADSLNIGDIIQFKRGDILISHRIEGVVEEDNKVYFKTKGDNNNIADSELVASEQVKGKVLKIIPKAGWVTLFIKSYFSVYKDTISVHN